MGLGGGRGAPASRYHDRLRDAPRPREQIEYDLSQRVGVEGLDEVGVRAELEPSVETIRSGISR